jgi:transposase
MYGKGTWVNARAMRAHGMSYVEIGAALGIDRRTVKKLCMMEDIPEPEARERSSIIDPFAEVIDAWLEKRPSLKASVIAAQLEPLGYAGSYATVKRYVASKKADLTKRATVRFETLPGYQAQVDFGKVRVAFLSGEVERIVFFALQMGFSRYRTAYVCPDETQDTLIACLSNSFSELGGVPSELLVDNMKPVVTKPRSRSEEAVFTDGWTRFCAYHGLSTNACWPYRAQTKGKVERLVGVVKGFLSSRTFLDIDHLESELAQETLRYNSSVHSTTRQEPMLRLELERNYLGGLPEHPFSYTVTHRRTASRDLLVSFEGSKYSVPSVYAARKVKVKASPSEVLIFSGEGALVASHLRKPKGSGATIMDPDHYEGLPGADLAFTHLQRLQELGLSPFTVERRPLSVYAEVTLGDR